MALVTLLITLMSPLLVVMLVKWQCRLGEKQGSVQSSVAEVDKTIVVTSNITLTAAVKKILKLVSQHDH